MNLNTYCPKCNSNHVDIKLKDKPKEPKRISMDELVNQPKFPLIQAVIRLKDYIATCRDCGYYVEWTE